MSKETDLTVCLVTDKTFAPYGRVIESYDLSAVMAVMEQSTPLPEAVAYVPSVAELEALPVMQAWENRFFGGLPIQIGYCNGHNKYLNAVEYHRSSELNVAVTDMILLLGKQEDIEADFSYNTSRIKAFMVPAGTCVEIYGDTLHYAPCHIGDQGFRCVVVLPRDTNTELVCVPAKKGEDALLFAKNKWLIGHPDAGLDESAFIALKGENIKINL